jgi:hypothetical protein
MLTRSDTIMRAEVRRRRSVAQVGGSEGCHGTRLLIVVVRDQSASGARLDVASLIRIPEWFDFFTRRHPIENPQGRPGEAIERESSPLNTDLRDDLTA